MSNLERKKAGQGYTQSGCGRGFTSKPIVYLIRGKYYAKHKAGAASAFDPLQGDLEGYVRVNAVYENGKPVRFFECLDMPGELHQYARSYKGPKIQQAGNGPRFIIKKDLDTYYIFDKKTQSQLTTWGSTYHEVAISKMNMLNLGKPEDLKDWGTVSYTDYDLYEKKQVDEAEEAGHWSEQKVKDKYGWLGEIQSVETVGPYQFITYKKKDFDTKEITEELNYAGLYKGQSFSEVFSNLEYCMAATMAQAHKAQPIAGRYFAKGIGAL